MTSVSAQPKARQSRGPVTKISAKEASASQPAATKAKARAAKAPAAVVEAPARVASVDALGGYLLRVRFSDGLEGTVDMTNVVHGKSAGVFAKLSDKKVFREARVEQGAVIWPCGLDLASDDMHRAIRASGRWTL